MKDVGFNILCALFGFMLGLMFGVILCRDTHTKPMEALGIEKFQKCEINTTNCHSNWYEIIWKEGTK